MTTVSLIIPCYNDGAYLRECLDSVFAGTRLPDQVVVVDDGSTDNSAEIARSFGDRITLVAQANQGISGARNTGLAATTGELITFLDADDLWPSDSLACRVAFLEAEPQVDVVFGHSEQFLTPDISPELRAKLYCPPGLTPARFAGAMVIRRAAYERVGDFATDVRVGEMMDWLARLGESGARMEMLPDLVMRRRIHGDNTVLREKVNHGDYLRVLKASLDRKAAAARGA